MKKFNTTGVCIPSKHYMTDLSDRVKKIRTLVEEGKYFTINRARQYGKTTTLTALKKRIAGEYTVISLDFQGISESGFRTEQEFVQEFSRLIIKRRRTISAMPPTIEKTLTGYTEQKEPKVKLSELFITLSEWCELSGTGVVLIIDEVDSAANNQVFLDFLAQLRDGYIARDTDDMPAFQSVILAGVTDVKHLKSKIRQKEDEKENSPWNIAADFRIDMSLSETGIRGMLEEYESDHHTGMDTAAMARRIREYTNGYPFLVSRICQLIDERLAPAEYGNLSEAWTGEGIESAVRMILTEKNTLFDSLMGKLRDRDYQRLADRLRAILLYGESAEFLPDNREQQQLLMLGFIENDHNTVRVANRIFEMRLYKYFVGESRFADEMRGDALDHKPAFTEGGRLNVPLIMERFIETQKTIRNILDEAAEKRFVEEEGREKFLTYLAPIINGAGTYSIEEQTRNRRRMDIVIHYMGRRYVIELKIWHGERYNASGEKQISDYLDYFGLSTGYMLSFSFNRKRKKETGVKMLHINDKLVYEGIV